MSTVVSAADVQVAVLRVCQMIEEREAVFNQLDANTGDGDMGSTLQIVAKAIMANGPSESADLGHAFARMAMVVARTSGSSLSAVIMTGLVSASKSLAGRDVVGVGDFHDVLVSALAAMQARSRARFDDKTILDGIRAITLATAVSADFQTFGRSAVAASTAALAEFRGKPCRIGRARLSSEGGVGIDDPGMVFLRDAVAAMCVGR